MIKLFYIPLLVLLGCPKEPINNPIVKQTEVITVIDKPMLLEDSTKAVSHSFDRLVIKDIDSLGLRVKGKYYSKSKKGFPVKSFTANNIDFIDNKVQSLTIQSIDTKVDLGNIRLVRTKDVEKDSTYGNTLSLTTEAIDFEHGMDITIKSITANHPVSRILFLQNWRSLNIGTIRVDSAMWNKGGEPSLRQKYSVKLFKFDNALSPEIDFRKGVIDSLIVTNSNAENGGGAALWLDEGTNNITFNYVDVDMPIWTRECNEYCPPQTGHHYFKKLIIRGDKRRSQSTLLNSTIDTLEIDSGTSVWVRNCKIGVLKGRIAIIDSLTTIDKIIQ